MMIICGTESFSLKTISCEPEKTTSGMQYGVMPLTT